MDHARRLLSDDEIHPWYTQGDAAHDFDHVRRVARLAEQIALAEGADVAVVHAAALLHDVPVQEGRVAHHLAAAEFARQHLLRKGAPVPQVENVVHCIQAHRFRDQTVRPQTLEAQCLYDADKLDGIGAIGVARAFAHAGAQGSRLWIEPWAAIPPGRPQPQGAGYTPVHEFVYKLRRVLATLYTPTGRRIGQERHDFMVAFFDRLDAEMDEVAGGGLQAGS